MRKEVEKVYIGVDESNHGKYPEYFAAVFSPFESDVTARKMKKQREKCKHQNLLSMLARERDYSFLRLEKPDDEKLGKDKLGIVIASLISDCVEDYEIRGNYTEYAIFVDGIIDNKSIGRARSIVSDLTEIEKQFLIIKPSSDERIPIVNYADELAHFFFRHTTSHDQNTKYLSHHKALLRTGEIAA
jgi:hypothetical protein